MKNWHLPFFRMRIDCLISKSFQLHAKKKQRGRHMQEGWRLFEWWLKQQAAADHAWVMDLLWTNSICAHILGLALFSIGFCIPANLLYVVKIYFTPFFCICSFPIWNKFALDKLNSHFMWAKSICMQTLELVYQFSSKFQLFVFFLTNLNHLHGRFTVPLIWLRLSLSFRAVNWDGQPIALNWLQTLWLMH